VWWNRNGKPSLPRGVQSDGILKEAAKEGSEVDPPCITITVMQIKEGDVKAHRAEVEE
jgi:hypothetical protein